ncbi:MAG: phenylalanine--tRNA ligase subunit alpha, partial [Sulfolobales archaeon]
TIDRVFRPDTPDPTHLMEFHQLDGIIVGARVSFKDLLQFFREFARGLGLGEVRFKPAYFPFTEPSVEGYVKHLKLGWIEVLPGGMFRRQVLEPLGLRGYNVAAWGIGVDRVAMILLGISDIRDLYTDDVREIEKAELPRVILGAGSLG